MTSFQITLPSLEFPLGLIQAGDDVIVQFDWFVAVARAASTQRHGKMVPLVLDLPTPAFKGIPATFQLGPKVEWP